MSEEWCDLCDLPKDTCVHGRPPVEPPAPVRKAPAARTPRVRAESKPKASGPKPVYRASAKQFTPSSSFRSHIVAVLEEHGGSLDVEELMAEVAERMESVLLERDHDTVPGGELRWRRAARKERAAMIDDGVLAPGKASGVWALSD